jgi:hypothetical protein
VLTVRTTGQAAGDGQPTSPRPKGHIWSTRLSSWVVPITRKPGRRPSPDHIHCSEPPCWVLIEPLSPTDLGDPAAQGC